MLLISAPQDKDGGREVADTAWDTARGQKATQWSHGPPQCHREVPAWEEMPELLRELGDLPWKPTCCG